MGADASCHLAEMLTQIVTIQTKRRDLLPALLSRKNERGFFSSLGGREGRTPSHGHASQTLALGLTKANFKLACAPLF